MIDRGRPPRAFAADIIAGRQAGDIPEHLRVSVQSHVDCAVFVYASAVLRERELWARRHRLELVPAGVVEQVKAVVAEKFAQRKTKLY